MFETGGGSEAFISAFSRHLPFTDADRALIMALPFENREISANSYLAREGQRPRRCGLLLDGFVFRQKLTTGGQRSIVGMQMPGDFTDLQNLFLNVSDHDLIALTRIVVAELPIDDLRRLALASPTIAQALWTAGLVEASIAREWLLNVGRRDAHARVAHLLCEISTRLEAAGVARELSYDLPMTQEQLGDALGLTSVHVNRVLKSLEQKALIVRRRREIAIADWDRLRRLADFNARYLHLALEGR